jgi:hypothetical protein
MRQPVKLLLAVAFTATLALGTGIGFFDAWGQGAQRSPRPQQGGNVPADFDTITPTITAGTTHTQAGATLCITTICVVTTASASDGVSLLQCPIAPQRQLIVNTTSATITVYAQGTDTINGTAGSTGVSQTGSGKTEYVCTAGGPGAAWWH